MDHYSYLLSARYVPLYLGIAPLLVAGVWMLTGEISNRRGGGDTISRIDDPEEFWWIVIFVALLGVMILGFFFYDNLR